MLHLKRNFIPTTKYRKYSQNIYKNYLETHPNHHHKHLHLHISSNNSVCNVSSIPYLLLLSFVTITIIICHFDYVDATELGQKCLCTVEKNGEYCGTELNELNSENNCPTKMFLCMDSNLNKTAQLLVDCKEGNECDKKKFFMNACLMSVDCECPKGLTRGGGQTYCGDVLVGDDCQPNITYTCPYLSMIFKPTPIDACLNGCQNGTCI